MKRKQVLLSRENKFCSWANAQNVSFGISLSQPIHIINPVDKTKLSCKYSPTHTAPQLLQKLTTFIHDHDLVCDQLFRIQEAVENNTCRHKITLTGLTIVTEQQCFKYHKVDVTKLMLKNKYYLLDVKSCNHTRATIYN